MSELGKCGKFGSASAKSAVALRETHSDPAPTALLLLLKDRRLPRREKGRPLPPELADWPDLRPLRLPPLDRLPRLVKGLVPGGGRGADASAVLRGGGERR